MQFWITKVLQTFHNHSKWFVLFCVDFNIIAWSVYLSYVMIMRVFTAHVHENTTLNIGNSTWAHIARLERVYDQSEGIMT